ncbi:hypothetical protein H3N56_02510 [Cetobacterium sp. 2A]|uniref:hypothetical protein n=1 Tax=Cetobacterium sp. 2A TaxID=2754723 RepID=UPI00163CFB67|nr:hypothetical protein [Cetobacterium sp. 2A]MBC2855365.1 hypothetical protein [Cetobacterium sp. 2A]
MMYVEIDKDLSEQLKIFFNNKSGIINRLLNKALAKTTTYIKKATNKEVKEEYDIYEGLINPGIKIVTKNGESQLLASVKRRDISDFYVSLMTPGKSKSKLLARVKKKNGETEMKTMFWAFHKENTSKLGLYMRLSNRKHITRVKSPSLFQMVTTIEVSEEVMSGANKVFNETLEKLFQKELENV